MSKWIDFPLAERKVMIQRVVSERNIDEATRKVQSNRPIISDKIVRTPTGR